MSRKYAVTIWDTSPARIAAIERNLIAASKRAGVRVDIDSQSEPPMVSRMNLMHRVPTLEIGGMFWTLVPGEVIAEDACAQLLTMIRKRDEERDERLRADGF